MTDQRLLQYIQQELQKGFSMQAISGSLLRSGYTQRQVQEAINELQQLQQSQKQQQSQQQQQSRQQQQAQQLQQSQQQRQSPKQSAEQIASFIKTQLQQGYPLPQIQQYLAQQGYPQKDILNAVSLISGKQQAQTQQQRKPFPTKILLTLFITLLIIGAGVAASLYFLKQKEPAKLMDVSIALDQKTAKPGSTVYISNNFINLPSKRKEDITMIYTVKEETTSKEIDTWKETFTKDDAIKKSTKYIVPITAKPGAYLVEVSVSYEKFSKIQTAQFKVIVETVEATCFDNKKNQDEEGIDCGGKCGQCVKEQPQEEVEYQPITNSPEISGGGQEIETDRELKTKANNAITPDVSIALCQQIKDAYNQNQCLNEAAQKFQLARICEDINKEDGDAERVRDTCYWGIMTTKNDFALCEKITNHYLVDSCNNIKKVNNIQQAIVSDDIDAISAAAGLKIEDA